MRVIARGSAEESLPNATGSPARALLKVTRGGHQMLSEPVTQLDRRRAPSPAPSLLASEWLDAEVERIWLVGELELRRLQHAQLRPPPGNAAVADVEAALSERRMLRNGKPTPLDAQELDRALQAALKQVARTRDAAMQRLRERLGLTVADIEGLLIVVAPSLDPQLADLFAIVRGPAMARRGVDVALIAQLLGCGRSERLKLLELIDDGRVPVAHKLIQVAPTQEVYSSASYRSIQPTLDLVWLLTTAGDAPSPSLRHLCELRRASPALDELLLDETTRTALDKLAACFRPLREAGPLPWVTLWGGAGSGKREVAARLAATAGHPLYTLDLRAVDKAQLVDVIRRAVRDAAWLGAALFIGPLLSEELVQQPQVMAELERVRGALFFGFATLQAPRLHSARPLGELHLPVPEVPLRAALWRRELGQATADVDGVARGYRLTPGEIVESAREAQTLAGAALDAGELRDVVERRLRSELGSIATRINVTTSWDDVILPETSAARVRELIDRKRHEDRVFRQWGLGQRVAYGTGVVALLSGEPGTGKTLLAGLIARELGFELYQVDLSQVFSRWIGETEKALAKVFDHAERAHAVLLFDEADALFARRTDVVDARDRYANVAVNYLLQRLERYSGVAVLTTNKEAYLDEALRRRLSLHLVLDKPGVAERARLWRKHLPESVPGAATVDVEAIAAEYELSGGYIRNVALRATFFAAAADTSLTLEHLRRAARLELEDLGSIERGHKPAAASGLFDSTAHAHFVD
jgi:AAA+ superfamily predicted ATPase